MKVRPKRTLMYYISSFNGKGRVYLNCYPQQKWDALVFRDRREVRLNRQNVSMYIPIGDFEENWVTVEEKKIKTYRDN